MIKFKLYYSTFFLCVLMATLSFPNGCVRREPSSTYGYSFNISTTNVDSFFIYGKGYIYVIFLDSTFSRYIEGGGHKYSERKIKCEYIFNNKYELSFTCKSQDGKTGSMLLGDNMYDHKNGNVFLVMMEENNLIIKQHKLDKNYLIPDDDIFRRMYSNDEVVKKFFHVKDLPDYLDNSELEQIGAKFQTYYNAIDYDALYEMMDNIAKASFNREKFTENMNKKHHQLGMIEQIKYDRYEYFPDESPIIDIYYKMFLEGGTTKTAILNVSLFDNGDGYGIRRFHLEEKLK